MDKDQISAKSVIFLFGLSDCWVRSLDSAISESEVWSQ